MKRHRHRSRRQKRAIRILFFLLVTSPVWLFIGWALLWFTGYVSLPVSDVNVDG